MPLKIINHLKYCIFCFGPLSLQSNQHTHTHIQTKKRFYLCKWGDFREKLVRNSSLKIFIPLKNRFRQEISKIMVIRNQNTHFPPAKCENKRIDYYLVMFYFYLWCSVESRTPARALCIDENIYLIEMSQAKLYTFLHQLRISATRSNCNN